MTDTAVDPLTTRTRIAVAIARGFAASLGHDNVTATHISVGLLREGENPAVAVLHQSGVALRAIRRELEGLLDSRGRTGPEEVALPLTPGEQQVVEHARAESRLRDDENLGTEHLLLAILREAHSPAAQAFARRGISFETALT
ncbi:MAG: Clp protease N-terminal domain-containing protein, partial [Longimicrobiales bacterium]